MLLARGYFALAADFQADLVAAFLGFFVAALRFAQ
jgi:hypothetical protein